MMKARNFSIYVLVAVFGLFLIGCGGAKLPEPSQIAPPTPISDNSGSYMCPYTSDGVVAMWVDKAVNAGAASQAGGAIGAYAGAKALEQVPFLGGFLGAQLGAAMGRKIAIESSGGWEYIKETSDLSFNSLEDMSVWLYATKSTNEHYDQVFKATCGIYPELKDVYYNAIQQAGR